MILRLLNRYLSRRLLRKARQLRRDARRAYQKQLFEAERLEKLSRLHRRRGISPVDTTRATTERVDRPRGHYWPDVCSKLVRQ